MYRTIRTRMHLHQTVLENNTSTFHKNIGKQQRLKTKQETTYTNTHQAKTSTSKPNPKTTHQKTNQPTRKIFRWSFQAPRSCIHLQLHCWHTRPRCRCLLPGLVLLCTMVLNNSGPGSQGEAQRPLRYKAVAGRIRP